MGKRGMVVDFLIYLNQSNFYQQSCFFFKMDVFMFIIAYDTINSGGIKRCLIKGFNVRWFI